MNFQNHFFAHLASLHEPPDKTAINLPQFFLKFSKHTLAGR